MMEKDGVAGRYGETTDMVVRKRCAGRTAVVAGISRLLVPVFLCSCVSCKTTMDDGMEEVVLKANSPEEVGERIFNCLEQYAATDQVKLDCCYRAIDGVGLIVGWIDSQFKLECHGYTNHVRTLHMKSTDNINRIPLRKVHPSVEAIELSTRSGRYDLEGLECCPNVKYLKIECQPASELLSRIDVHFPNLEVLYVNNQEVVAEPYAMCAIDSEDAPIEQSRLFNVKGGLAIASKEAKVGYLSFSKGFPRLRMLVYLSSAPIGRLAESVSAMVTTGNVSRLLVEATYYGDNKSENTHKNEDFVCRDAGLKGLMRIDAQPREFSEVYVDALLKSMRCESLSLECINVIPCNLWAVEHIKKIYLRLEINGEKNAEFNVRPHY